MATLVKVKIQSEPNSSGTATSTSTSSTRITPPRIKSPRFNWRASRAAAPRPVDADETLNGSAGGPREADDAPAGEKEQGDDRENERGRLAVFGELLHGVGLRCSRRGG